MGSEGSKGSGFRLMDSKGCGAALRAEFFRKNKEHSLLPLEGGARRAEVGRCAVSQNSRSEFELG